MDDILTLQEAVESAKNFENFDDVLLTVTLHPEWVTTIPGERNWAIIHHVVYSGDIEHLDRLLTSQKSNKNFRLLVESRKNETILDIAKVLNDEGKMYKHIQRLVTLDEMLDYAKSSQWDKCYEIVQANPNYGNEKPPYRRFYLIHHIACANAIKQFERFEKIPNFKFNMNLRADQKKINVIARENNGLEFAKYIEKNYQKYFEEDDALYEPSNVSRQHTNQMNYLMEQRNISQESDLSFGPVKNLYTRGEADKQMKEKLLKQQAEKAKANKEKKVIHQYPIDTVRSLLTCHLTNAIVSDPGMYSRLIFEIDLLLFLDSGCCGWFYIRTFGN
jgi:hypothetical protein